MPSPLCLAFLSELLKEPIITSSLHVAMLCIDPLALLISFGIFQYVRYQSLSAGLDALFLSTAIGEIRCGCRP